MENTTRYKPEVETVLQTGSINNLATETDIDAISVAIPMFWDKFFTGVYANLNQRFFHPEISRWRSYTGSSYNFATEKDIRVISMATAIFQGTLDPLPSVSTLSNFRQQHQVQTGSRNSTQNETGSSVLIS